MSIKRFYSDRYYHIRSFTLHALFAVALGALVYRWHDPVFYAWSFSPVRAVLYVLIGVYLGGISAVFIHNATHKSFPNRWLNEICGQLAGIHQLWGFMGWRIIHLFHHSYSDRTDRDPHPPKGKTFGHFLRVMFIGSSRSISERYREHWGMSARTRLLHAGVMVTFHIMAAGYLFFWYALLGPQAFVFGYIPSLVWNHVMFASINYHCHPVNPETGETHAVNLNDTLFHRVANALWFGIYFHGNHHRKATLFNPRKLQARREQDTTFSSPQTPVGNHA